MIDRVLSIALVKPAQITAGILGCIATLAGGVLAFLSLFALILSTSPSAAIAMAWWSLSLSLVAVALAGIVMIVGARGQGIGASLGFSLPVLVLHPSRYS